MRTWLAIAAAAASAGKKKADAGLAISRIAPNDIVPKTAPALSIFDSSAHERMSAKVMEGGDMAR